MLAIVLCLCVCACVCVCVECPKGCMKENAFAALDFYERMSAVAGHEQNTNNIDAEKKKTNANDCSDFIEYYLLIYR